MKSLARMIEERISALGVIVALVFALCILLTPRPARAASLTITNLDENLSVADVVATAVAASGGGDTAPNDGHTYLYVNNGGSGSITVTVTAQNTTIKPPGGGGVMTKSNITDTIAAGKEGLMGPFPPGFFNNSVGQISITYSAVTSVKVLAVRLAQS
jgi:hypothetical protein